MNDCFAIDLTMRDPGILGRGPNLSAEASDLEIPVGFWPNVIRARGRTRTIDFERTGQDVDHEGELRSVSYAGGGFTLTVWND